MSLLKIILIENQNKRIHYVVTILHNLIAKEIINNVTLALKNWLARLWSKLSKNHIKAQMRVKIFSDTFLISSDDIDISWEYHHQILGNDESRLILL